MLNSSINSTETSRTGKSGDASGVPSHPFMITEDPSLTIPQDLRSQPMPFSGIPNTPDFRPDVDGGDQCRRTQSLLSAYLDRELDPRTLNAVEAHLTDCPHCANVKNDLAETDSLMIREWQRTLPLPSKSLTPKENRSIDAILAALPPEPLAEPQFAPRRVHARARWMRFSAGLAGIIALIGICWRGR